jgi:hypothetical protein
MARSGKKLIKENCTMKKEKTKWYQVEIMGTTYRTYDIKAESKEKAEELALDAVDEDWEISKAWKRNAEVSYIEEFEKEVDS